MKKDMMMILMRVHPNNTSSMKLNRWMRMRVTQKTLKCLILKKRKNSRIQLMGEESNSQSIIDAGDDNFT